MEGGPINLPGIPGSESVPAIPGSDVGSGVPGPQPESRGRRLWLWLELLIAASLTVLLGLAGLGFLLNAVGAHQHRGGSRAGQAVGAAISFGLVVLSTRWAIRVEHRLRRRQPVAEAFAIAAAAPAPAREVRSSPLRVRPRRHYGPVATGVALALFAGAAIGFAVGSVSSHSQGVRSAFVQHHGTRASAIVESVDNTQHCSRSSCYYTAAIVVTLSPPVDGVRVTVVQYAGFSDLVAGETVIVLVDPKQPGYAEFPGSRFVTSWEWIIFAGIAVFFACLTVFEARALRKLLAHRRDQLSKTTSAVATAG